mmetsp:Transcript_14197/g.32967  ORF Transcript_14197/g.32967 Transcript_14197/m.32967 type:complete len:222 (+) Transcript_14197:548-1213(+)
MGSPTTPTPTPPFFFFLFRLRWVFHEMWVTPGRASSRASSFMRLRHMFLRTSRVMPLGLGAAAVPTATLFVVATAPGSSNPLSVIFDSYSWMKRSSVSRYCLLETMPCSTHKSHRTSRVSFFRPSLSAKKQSLQMRDGTPQVGHRRLPRYMSQGLWQASHLPMTWALVVVLLLSSLFAASLSLFAASLLLLLLLLSLAAAARPCSSPSILGGAWAKRLSKT